MAGRIDWAVDAPRWRALVELAAEHPEDHRRLRDEASSANGALVQLGRLHPQRYEQLLAAEEAVPWSEVAECGTPSGYQRHVRLHQEVDEACRAATRAAQTVWTRAHREQLAAKERCRTRARAALAAQYGREYRELLCEVGDSNAARTALAHRYPVEYRKLLAAELAESPSCPG